MTDAALLAAIRRALANGSTATEIGARCGVHSSTVEKWNSGDKVPKNRLVRRELEKWLRVRKVGK